jgi:acyl carrier protein
VATESLPPSSPPEELFDIESIQQAMAADSQSTAVAAPQPYRAPSTPTQRTIAKIWENLLGRKEVGVDEDLFSVGGDSILALQILARTHESFHIQLRMDILFTTSFTIERLSHQVDEQMIAQADPAELAALLQEMEGLSEEEVRTLLDQANPE